VVIVSGDRRDLRVGHGDFRVEPGELQMLLVLLWAVMAASQRQNQRIVTLQFTELASSVRVIGQLVIWEYPTGDNV
jgi:hypothetical protein